MDIETRLRASEMEKRRQREWVRMGERERRLQKDREREIPLRLVTEQDDSDGICIRLNSLFPLILTSKAVVLVISRHGYTSIITYTNCLMRFKDSNQIVQIKNNHFA